jgi:hypothetical protein
MVIFTGFYYKNGVFTIEMVVFTIEMVVFDMKMDENGGF